VLSSAFIPRRLGIFGGTFDPPHLAHLILAAEASYQLNLELVLWILTPYPPHKEGRPITPLRYRLEMIEAALASDPIFQLSRVDIDRSAPHYAVDTMNILKESYPQATLIYLMGGDSLRDLPLWKRPKEFLDACHGLGVIRRPGDLVDLPALETRLPGLSRKVQFVEAPLLEISATQIRQRVASGQPFRYFLPPAVYRIIQEHQLYR
jgi:nicotinate-nucleotide adenylyltransferase